MKAAPKFKKGDRVIYIRKEADCYLVSTTVRSSFLLGDEEYYHLEKMGRDVTAVGETNLEFDVVYGSPLYHALK